LNQTNKNILGQEWKKGWIFNKASHPSIIAWVVDKFNGRDEIPIEIKSTQPQQKLKITIKQK
jgi:hypothetical protein